MKGTHVVLLDVAERFGLTDYFLIAGASNRRMVQAMATEVDKQMKAAGIPKARIEGFQAGWWVLMDFDEVVVHIFREEARAYYDLDLLWADTAKVDWRLPGKGQAG